MYFHPNRSARGRSATFTWQMLIKAVILQWHLQIANDTDFADYLKKDKDAVEICGMPRAPSHDIISKFTRKYGHLFHHLHQWFDAKLEEHGVFVNDELSGDGTNVPLHKPQVKPDADCFGAKSNKEKFYGVWLMLIVSVNTGLVRAFNYDKARIGQIKLMFDLLTSGIIQSGTNMFLDGIFDVKDIHAAVVFDQEGIPMIAYNPKNSCFKTRNNLPDNDWRGVYNEYFKDGLWMIIESSKRVSVERTNSYLKMNYSLKDVYERSRRLQKRSKNHIDKLIIGSIVMPQVEKLIEINLPKPITLINFMSQSERNEIEA
jgi:hypothetical protein